MSEKKSRFSNNIHIKNKKASFEYQFIDTFIAGIVLQGTEIKSIREAKANLQESYCAFKGEELWVLNLHISPYDMGTHSNHEAKRERKLLLSKKELRKLDSKSKEKGLTIIPTRLFVNERGLAKIEIALAKGKKLYDKREDIKQKDIKREMDRAKM
jgi:SsrA-binding protein